MRNLNIFLFEWKHFIRSPFKVLAVLLFIIAGVYGLHTGSDLYHKQSEEISKIDEETRASQLEVLQKHYETGNYSDEDRPWIDYSDPYWAIRYASIYHFKKPSAAMVFSIGQAEQYGFYKQIKFWSSPYDADLAEEIANPERLQTGTLDFSFAVLFLMPLVLLVLVYNLKSAETELGFLSLIEVQHPSSRGWLISRLGFHGLLLYLVTIGLLIYGANLTDVFASAGNAFGQMVFYTFIYLLFWILLYALILMRGKSILMNTLQMAGLYLLFAFIIPATVHQILSIRQPANLMTDFIDVRDQQNEIYDLEDSIVENNLIELFPELEQSVVYTDRVDVGMVRRRTIIALVNELKKKSVLQIEQENENKNMFISSSFVYNPLSFFQNKLNRISTTHYDDYQQYRDEIQLLIDAQINVLVQDMWNSRSVDKTRYQEYNVLFTTITK